jgi:O-antigen/teichoic acid export membrane protein
LPGGIAMYVITASDRWFIQHYQGEVELGMYALGAKFALLMTLAMETFRKAWWPIAMDAMHSPDGPDVFRAIARMFMGVGVAAVIYLTFLSRWLVDWVAGPAFQAAWPLVGVLAWQSLFYGFYMVASPGIWKAEKTHYSMYLMIGSALLNLALNAWLVPEYGGMGAAVATGLSYFVLLLLSMLVSERLWRVDFPLILLVAQILIGIVASLWLINTEAGWIAKAVVAHALVAVLAASALSRGSWRKLWGRSEHA